MLNRRCTLFAGSLLFLALLSVPASFAEPGNPACAALLPWEAAADGIVTSIEQDQPDFLLKTSCTTSAQCPTGQACHCMQCHDACPTGWRWSCGCQVCYKCPAQHFFDESLCACAHI